MPDARHRRALRHHQRALARRPPRQWPALGDVLLLRRRTRRKSLSATASTTATTPFRWRPSRLPKSSRPPTPSSSRNGRCGPTAPAPACIAAGLGAIYEIEALAKRGADVFLLGERGKFAPFGVGGGGSAALNRFCWQTNSRRGVAADGLQDHRREDRQRATRAAGNARRRRLGRTRWPAIPPKSPAMSRLGYIAKSAARDDYAVVLSPDGAVDIAETEALRARRAA